MIYRSWKGRVIDYVLLAAVVGFESVAVALFTGSNREHAFAYIDPGVGAMIVQAIAAAFFGALFYFKNLRKAIGRFFLRLAGKTPAPEQIAAEAPAEKK